MTTYYTTKELSRHDTIARRLANKYAGWVEWEVRTTQLQRIVVDEGQGIVYLPPDEYRAITAPKDDFGQEIAEEVPGVCRCNSPGGGCYC